MRLSDLQCRCCGERYHDLDNGCEICILAKKNILTPDEDLTDIDSVVQHMLRIVEENMHRLERDMKKSVGDKYDNALPYEKHIKLARELATATTSLVAEQRKLNKEQQNTVKSLPIEKRIEIMLGWLVDLPPEYRELALQRLVRRLAPGELAQLEASSEG